MCTLASSRESCGLLKAAVVDKLGVKEDRHQLTLFISSLSGRQGTGLKF
jgi:hypothetical protein